MFSTSLENFPNFHWIGNLTSANSESLEVSVKFVVWGKVKKLYDFSFCLTVAHVTFLQLSDLHSDKPLLRPEIYRLGRLRWDPGLGQSTLEGQLCIPDSVGCFVLCLATVDYQNHSTFSFPYFVVHKIWIDYLVFKVILKIIELFTTQSGLLIWLVVWCSMPFSTVFQLYCSSQCAYSCFSGVLITSSTLNIHSKPLAAFPHNHWLSKQRTAVREEWILSQWLSSIFGKNIGWTGNWTCDSLFSSLQRYQLSYGAWLWTIIKPEK